MKKLLMTFVAFAMIVPCLAQKPGLVKDEDGYTNVRKGPGTTYDIVDQIPDGMFVYYKAGPDGWNLIYTPTEGAESYEFIGFMARNKIVVPKRSGDWKKVGKVKDEDGYTNIRKGPGTKYDIVGKVKDGGYILYSGGSNNQWYKVYKQDGTFRGYMARNKIMKTASPSF